MYDLARRRGTGVDARITDSDEDEFLWLYSTASVPSAARSMPSLLPLIPHNILIPNKKKGFY